MRKINVFLFIGLLLIGCTSSAKLLERGNYDEAIVKSSKELRKKPGKTKELHVLKEAYSKANQFDLDRIQFLEKEDRAENQVEIFNLYKQLDYRQNRIKALPSPLLAHFTIVNYDDQIIESKNRAAEISYLNGISYLEKGDRQSARLAYREFERVRQLYFNYKDVDLKLQEARYLGTNNVLFIIENKSDKILPKDFEHSLKKISLKDLNRNWLNYDTTPDSLTHYDYYVVMDISQIEVTPGSVQVKTYVESKEIEDGTRFVFDERGNVMKDSLGNDVKVPDVKKISANVIESIQQKYARISGAIDYIDLTTDQLVRTDEIIVDAVFEHYSAVATGNKEALSDETVKKIKNKPLPFPPDEELLMEAAHHLKERIKVIIHQNRNLLVN